MPSIFIQMSRLVLGLLGTGLIAVGPHFALVMVRAYLHRSRERQAAAELNTLRDYELRDMGIGRCQIDAQVRGRRKRQRSALNSMRGLQVTTGSDVARRGAAGHAIDRH